MYNALELIRIDFDNMENRHCITEKSIALFITEAGVKNAYVKLQEYIISTMPNAKLYAGYDYQVYPQFKTIEREIK